MLEDHRDIRQHDVRRREAVVQQMHSRLGRCMSSVENAGADLTRQLEVLRGLKREFREHVDLTVAALLALPDQFDAQVDALTEERAGKFSAAVSSSMSELMRVKRMKTAQGVGAAMARMSQVQTMAERGAFFDLDEVLRKAVGVTQPMRDRLEQARSVLGVCRPQQIVVRVVEGKLRSVLADLSQTVARFITLTVTDLFPETPTCSFYVVSEGRFLRSDRTLEEQGVGKGSTVHIRVGVLRAPVEPKRGP
jgi:Arc/MetJ-type ribon-helix-helix transcriptional regulator